MPAATAAPNLLVRVTSRYFRGGGLGQVFGSFVAVLAVYWLYSLLAIPLIEPSLEEEPVAQASEAEIRKASEQLNPRKEAVARYFPEGAWERDKPIIWERGQVQLLFKSPKTLADGTIQLEHCTLLLHPQGHNAVAGQEGQPIIMQTAEGARIRFKERIDLSSSNISNVKLDGGQLRGPILIHRRESQPGAGDDLEITTRDVELDENRAHSPHPVKFRMGRSHGSGRELVIALAPAEGGGPGKFGSDGVRMVQLIHDVVMHLELGSGLAGAATAVEPERLRITSQGPFVYDVQKRVASFRDRVDVFRARPAGQNDQLNCEVLNVFFGGAREQLAPQNPAAPVQPGAINPASMSVRMLEAEGDPVVLKAPSRGIDVQCRGLQYSPGPNGATLSMLAVGPGEMTGKMPDNPAEEFHVQWTREFRFEPDGPLHVGRLRGGATVRLGSTMTVTAEELAAWLSSKPPAGPNPRAAPGREAWQLERLWASGNVAVQSPQLIAHTGTFDAQVDRSAADPVPPDSAGGGDAERPPPQRRRGQRPAQNPSQRFEVRGGEIVATLVPKGEELAVSTITLDHVARLKELAPPTGQKPLLVEGDRMRVVSANTDEAHLTVTGQPAHVEAAGMTLRGAVIEVEQAHNHLWVQGPGTMNMPMEQDLNGRPLAKPENVNVAWQQGMDFRSAVAVFRGQVVVRGTQQLLRTEELEARLSRPIEFSGAARPLQPGKPAESPQLAEIRCHGRALLDGRETDERGQISSLNEMDIFDLTINRQSGEIRGHGPGKVQQVGRVSDPGPKPWRFVQVQFQKGVEGNIHRRQMKFYDTKSIYLPIDRWEDKDKVDLDDRENLGEQGVVIDAKELTVHQMPGAMQAERGWVELEALGNVRAQGTQFTARGHQLTYSEQKDQLTLRGDSLSPAEFFQMDSPSSPRRPFSGNALKYFLKLRHVQVEGIVGTGFDVPRAPKSAGKK